MDYAIQEQFEAIDYDIQFRKKSSPDCVKDEKMDQKVMIFNCSLWLHDYGDQDQQRL